MAKAFGDQVILQEQFDEDYEPTSEGASDCVTCFCLSFHLLCADIEDYAPSIGLDLDVHPELIWIARAGLKAPLPKGWTPWCVRI